MYDVLFLTWIFSLRRILTSKVLARPIPESIKVQLFYIIFSFILTLKLHKQVRQTRKRLTYKMTKLTLKLKTKSSITLTRLLSKITKLTLKLKTKSGITLTQLSFKATKLTLKLKTKSA